MSVGADACRGAYYKELHSMDVYKVVFCADCMVGKTMCLCSCRGAEVGRGHTMGVQKKQGIGLRACRKLDMDIWYMYQ